MQMRGRFCRMLCCLSVDFGGKAVEVLPKEGLCIGRGFLRGPTSPQATQVGGGVARSFT